METLTHTAAFLFDWHVILAALIGVTWGIMGGALPGISPSITMALLLPFTYTLDPTSAIVLLASTYIGAEYGGSVPAILIRTPGTNAAAATVIDGYEMNRQGKAGLALGISLYSGVIGSLFGLAMLMTLSGPLAKVALAFTPMAYFALGILGLSVIATLSGENLVKGLIAAILGLIIATIGSDPVTGGTRFTFGSAELLGGIEPVMIMVGLFAMSELLVQASKREQDERVTSRPRIQFPDWPLAKRLIPAQIIGNGIGTFEGVMPGAGGTIASFMSYNEARRWSRHPEEFGKGSPEGIAAPETANNTVAETALVPLLSFGIPGSNSTAILLGGFLIHGIVPGPMLFQKSGEVVYGLYAGLFTAAIGQLLIGMAMLPVCIWLVNRPRPYLNAFIFALILSGIYSIHNEAFDLGIMIAAGMLGFFMRMLRFPFLPTVLGLVLGYLVESNFRRSLVLSGDDWMIFVDDRISLGLLILAFLFIGGSIAKRIYDLVRHRPTSTFSESAES
ncbi:tripartite tricarboxylate transporter permease [Rhizobium sp. GN54]|uniref:tripartite tricarboxylate transporter permease n=1 Tax=Rhizobium sp. GN54 TaxID=2898150 RepID=UPI001E642DD3|nr:tripartite tricarboxylate transporter permease [Rhizobium sp. GN54]MCD2185306.1 tripartite tricarboxylate transporter permease [Rhizobium sp. GN54]